MPVDHNIRDHQAWLGYLQPEGLVVSPAALVDAQASLDLGQAAVRQRRFDEFIGSIPNPKPKDADREPTVSAITNLAELLQGFFNWPAERLQGLSADNPIPEALKIPLRDFGETLQPTYAFTEARPEDPERPWLLLVKELEAGKPLDVPVESKLSGWSASPTRRFERLLREADVPIGLLSNATHLQLVYAPRGENAGTLTFPIAAMIEIPGRPILAALDMLLSRYRLLAAPTDARLPGLLKRSRDYQGRVSTALAGQVLDALYELLRGFQAANDHTKGELLKRVLADEPDQIYGGLLSVLMRLVFLLYAEDQGMMPDSDLYARNYAVHGLFQRLRNDAEQYPDTMDNRYGAWAQLVALSNAVYRGSKHPLMKMPARQGHLFNPDRYTYLEGRTKGENADQNGKRHLPLVADGVIFRILEKLLVLDGERLSYRTLDVEQIGSVYETMMGFRLVRAGGTTIALKPNKCHGAPVPISIDELLATGESKRKAFIKEATDYELTASMDNAIKEARSVEDVLAALENRIVRSATPQPVSAGTMVLTPTDERRRSGSHYTPRSLTEPIVRTTLEPILAQLVNHGDHREHGEQREDKSDTFEVSVSSVVNQEKGLRKSLTRGEIAELERRERRKQEAAEAARQVGTPHPSQILDLKICDPAMGSGAFLVEACRQLADHLVESWAAHADSLTPDPRSLIPPDEDEVLYARRLVAQRCLYGVDKNAMAVDLAKLSLWLVTLARDHPFTFLDHALRHGDSLVGLTRRQIIGFHWEPKKQKLFGEDLIQKRLDRATEARAKIFSAREDSPYRDQEQRLALANEALEVVRLTGNACVSAFFAGSKKKEREDRCEELFASVSDWYASGHDISKRGPIAAAAASLRSGEHPIPPFHWEIEFPEVFSRDNAGFDGFVGNPPFLGGMKISVAFGVAYIDWLLDQHADAHGNGDLVAHFFRGVFTMLTNGGALGLVATNSIAQGDTRRSGLRWICNNGGTIFNATRRLYWPGDAAVVVSIVHIQRGTTRVKRRLDGRETEKITAFLFTAGSDDDPHRLIVNKGKARLGVKVLGVGFLFDDDIVEATPVSEMQRLLTSHPRLKSAVHPFVGGEDINRHPRQNSDRFIIDFGDAEEDEARTQWPQLMSIVEDKVQPQREAQKNKGWKKHWWRFAGSTTELRAFCAERDRVLAIARVSKTAGFVFLATSTVFSEKVVVFASDSMASFCALQSRIHECWMRLFSSTLKDDLNYTPSDCFETFPFSDPTHDQADAGERYYSHRATIMNDAQEGLTKTYNRFNDPHEQSPAILHLRELHAAMDRAVLEAYGWDDLADTARCEFLLDYEEEDSGDGGQGSGAGKKSKKKLPWRLRWPDDFRDEVLARLLELNEQRHQEEVRTGLAAEAGEKKKAAKKRATKKRESSKEKASAQNKELF